MGVQDPLYLYSEYLVIIPCFYCLFFLERDWWVTIIAIFMRRVQIVLTFMRSIFIIHTFISNQIRLKTSHRTVRKTLLNR